MRVQPLLKVLVVGGTVGAFIAGAPPSSGAARPGPGAAPARIFVVTSDGDDPDPDAGQPDDDDVCAAGP